MGTGIEFCFGVRRWIEWRRRGLFFFEKLMIWFDRKKKEREIMEGMMERKERNQESFLVTKEMGNEWRILEFFKVKYKGAPTCSYNNICLSRIWKALFPFPCLFPSSFFLVGKHLYVYFAASLTSNFLLIIFYFFRAHLKNEDTYFHLLLLSFNYIFIFKKIIKKLIK